MNIRQALAEALKPLLPKPWRIIPYADSPANLRHPVIVIKTKTVSRNAGAPRLYRDHKYELALLVPEIDPEKAEDALDVALEALLDALDEVAFPGLIVGDADRATFDDKFHGYTVAVTITTQKE